MNEVRAMNEEWQWWLDKLAGKPVQMNPDNPRAGFYRKPYKEFYGARRTFQPVAYWPGPRGGLRCRIGDEDVSTARGQRLWQAVGDHPVTEEAYREVAERGGYWPDEHELAPMQPDNRPPEDDSYEGLRDAIEDLAHEADKRIDGPVIEDQAEADRVANLADRLAELWNKAETARKQERKPLDSSIMKIQKKWAPLLTKAESYKNLKYKLLTPWLKKVQREIEDRKAAEVQAGETPTEAKRPRVGTRGRAMSLKTIKRAEIYDYTTCLNYFAESADIKATVQDLANRMVRSGGPVPPGCNVIEETQAV